MCTVDCDEAIAEKTYPVDAVNVRNIGGLILANIRGEARIIDEGKSIQISLYCEHCGELVAKTSGTFPSSKLMKTIEKHEHGTPIKFLSIKCPVEGCNYCMTDKANYPPHALLRHYSRMHKPFLASIEAKTSISILVSKRLLARAQKKDPAIISHLHDVVEEHLRRVIKEG